MKTENSKLALGLLIGAAVGAAIGALVVASTKEDFMDELSDIANNAKKKINRTFKEGLEELDMASDKISKAAHNAVNKVKELHH